MSTSTEQATATAGVLLGALLMVFGETEPGLAFILLGVLGFGAASMLEEAAGGRGGDPPP